MLHARSAASPPLLLLRSSVSLELSAETPPLFSQLRPFLSTLADRRLLDRCGNPGAAAIERLNSSTLWSTFVMVFSYEKWSSMGPPLYLLGNPNFHIGAPEWAEFVHGFKKSLASSLQYNVTQNITDSPLCMAAAATIQSELKIGIYWARRALEAWGAMPLNATAVAVPVVAEE